MKKSILLAASLLALNLTPVFGQPNPNGTPPSAPPFQQRLKEIVNSANAPQNQPPALTKFNLDFPGGTAKELVATIEKAMKKPLNVIIANEDADAKLPPIKGSELDVAKLFQTLSENGAKYSYSPGNRDLISNYGFKTIDQTPSDSSLWTFYSYTKPTLQTQFGLDFPGGTPAQLVKAIEKATGKPLNAIILTEDADLQMPPLKMNDVTVPQLFAALKAASQKNVAYQTSPSGNSYSTYGTGYGFTTTDTPVTDNTMWYFRVEKPTLPPVVSTQKVSQFYSLSPYLDRGFTVDDITTAIQTGWKMAGETPTPELNYHKETKLLIAYGEPQKLRTIEQVLNTLPQTQYSRTSVESQIKQLQTQVDQLKKQLPIPAAPPANVLELKSGQ